MILTIAFRRVASPGYLRAVALAQRHPSYRVEGQEHVVDLAVTSPDLTLALEIWSVIRGWRTATIAVDGALEPFGGRYRLLELLRCTSRALVFTDPRRYCAAPVVPEDDTRPPVPCRYWMARWRYLLDGIDWAAPTWSDALWAHLVEFGAARCPFLDRARVDRAVEAWRADIVRATPLPDEPVNIDRLIRRLLPGADGN